MFAGKALRCDCGYEVRASNDGAFVDGIRRHAREAHGIEFSLALALQVARDAQLASSESERLEPEQIEVNREEKQ